MNFPKILYSIKIFTQFLFKGSISIKKCKRIFEIDNAKISILYKLLFLFKKTRYPLSKICQKEYLKSVQLVWNWDVPLHFGISFFLSEKPFISVWHWMSIICFNGKGLQAERILQIKRSFDLVCLIILFVCTWKIDKSI